MEIGGGGESFSQRRIGRSAINGMAAAQENHLMTAAGKETRQFGTELAGGGIRQPANFIKRLIGRPRRDQAFHAPERIAGIGRMSFGEIR